MDEFTDKLRSVIEAHDKECMEKGKSEITEKVNKLIYVYQNMCNKMDTLIREDPDVRSYARIAKKIYGIFVCDLKDLIDTDEDETLEEMIKKIN